MNLRIVRRLPVTVVLAGLLGAAIALRPAAVGAQEEPADGGESQGGAVVTQQSQSYVFEGVLTVALFGAALFAVCRSSARGR